MHSNSIDSKILEFKNINGRLHTPAFIYDEKELRNAINDVKIAANNSACSLLYSTKSCDLAGVLNYVKPYVDGFAVSSLFEAKLSKGIGGKNCSIHMTSPAIRVCETNDIFDICDYFAFNSFSQWKLYGEKALNLTRCGLRINPELSLVDDDRYNPCKKYSKLGVKLSEITNLLSNDIKIFSNIDGLHLHTNCDSSNFSGLLATVKKLNLHIPQLLSRIQWINLGGGYLFSDVKNLNDFYLTVDLLKSKYGLNVIIEPGASIVRKAGYLVSTVLDIFKSDGKTIAILDVSVNHMPEVYEYQFEPDVINHYKGANFNYILAGSSCLAGDVFGEYSFHLPLQIGSKIIFANMGAYTTVKWNMFNGINLPTIYSINDADEVVLEKEFYYEDFISKNGVEKYVY